LGLFRFSVDEPNSLFVTSNGDIYVGNSDAERIDKWTRNSSLTRIGLDSDEACYGLFVDINNTLYCSMKDANKVAKKLLQDINDPWTDVVTNEFLWPQEELDQPYGIFVDLNFDLYVADYGNDRVQLFRGGRSDTGSIVSVGDNIKWPRLKGPTNVILDYDKNLYILDTSNHRIIFLDSKFEQYRCLIGCNTNNDYSSGLLNLPIGISFDRFGNILISDTNNNRVLKFLLETPFNGKFNKYPVKNK
jgi:hypothetical protein